MVTNKKFWTPINVLVTTYAFSWGFASLDRLLIAMLFPFIIPFFGMNFSQAGLIMTCMSVLYLIMASLGGALSDKYGRKKVIFPSVIIFSIGSFLTGFAANFAVLIGIRSIIGGAEGAFFVSGGAQIAEESPNEKRGYNLGLFNSAFPLFGACIAPIYATQVAALWGWQWACFLTIIPGVILALVISTKIKDAKQEVFTIAESSTEPSIPWQVVLKDKNVILSALVAISWFIWLWSWLSFGMLFFTKVRGIETGAAGILLSAMGIGGFLGAILNSKLSDIYGRKIVMIIGSLIGIIGTLVVVLVPSLSFGSVFFVLLVTATACWGNAPIFLQIIPSDCVSREHLAKTLGVIVSIGEFVGIAIAPPLLGLCGDMYGLAATMLVGATSIVLTTLLSLALRESAPKFCQVQANPRLAE